VHRRIVRKVCKTSDGSLFGVMGADLLFVFPFAMAFAAATDLLTMRIPNVLTLGLAAAFL
jgi:Flp pilus assembly protein protease CpaA